MQPHSISIRYEPDVGPHEMADATFEIDDIAELWRRIRHNVGGHARQAKADGTDIIRFRETDAVPEVVRYYFQGTHLEAETGGGLLLGNAETPIGIRASEQHYEKKPVILLLLESPHTDESSCDLVGWRPAVGSTGVQIQSYRWILTYALFSLSAPELVGAPVILCNPLPFPASLRLTPLIHGIRDTVFEAAMTIDGIKQLFRRRLDQYDPLVVINACTKEMRGVVDDQLQEWFQSKKAVVQQHDYYRAKGAMQRRIAGVGTPTKYLINLPHPGAWHQVNPVMWFAKTKVKAAFMTWMRRNFRDQL